MLTPEQKERMDAYTEAAWGKDPVAIDAYVALCTTHLMEGVIDRRGYDTRMSDVAKMRKASRDPSS